MSLGTFLGLVVGLTAILIIMTILTVYILASLRIFFTFCPGGEIVAIVKGKEPLRFIMAHKGFHLNELEDKENFDSNHDRWDVLENSWRELTDEIKKKAKEKGYTIFDEGWVDTRNWLEKKYGIYWVGIYPLIQVHRYPFQWAEVQQKETPEREEGAPGLTVKVRDESVYSIFAKVFPYMMELKEAQTVDKLPVAVRYVLNTRCVNPLKALFWVDNWLAKTQTAANENARNYVGVSTYEALTSEIRAQKDREAKRKKQEEEESKKDPGAKKRRKPRTDKSFEDIMLELNERIEKGSGLKKLYGIEIVTVEIQSVDLTGKLGEAVSKATTAQYVAEQEAVAKKAEAEGIAAALKMEAEIMAANPHAARLRELKALENAGANVTIVARDIGVVPMLPINTGTPQPAGPPVSGS